MLMHKFLVPNICVNGITSGSKTIIKKKNKKTVYWLQSPSNWWIRPRSRKLYGTVTEKYDAVHINTGYKSYITVLVKWEVERIAEVPKRLSGQMDWLCIAYYRLNCVVHWLYWWNLCCASPVNGMHVLWCWTCECFNQRSPEPLMCQRWAHPVGAHPRWAWIVTRRLTVI